MMAAFIALAVCLSPVRWACAADSDAPAFEVASLKPSGPISPARERLFEMVANDDALGLPGGGQRVEIHGRSAAELVAAAYRIPLREIVGPSWISDARFDIDALIPSGQTRAKAPEMLLTLLQERLALKAHRDVRRTSGYILSVEESGPKLKEAPPFKPTADLGSLTSHSGPPFNGLREELGHCDMAQLANALAQQLREPVEDRTGLKGFYSILIQIPGDEMKDEAQRPAAFRDALKPYGLRLASGKIDAPILVIDNISKTPTPN
jgi:uncharacterized protein (TIGR03435 family)